MNWKLNKHSKQRRRPKSQTPHPGQLFMQGNIGGNPIMAGKVQTIIYDQNQGAVPYDLSASIEVRGAIVHIHERKGIVAPSGRIVMPGEARAQCQDPACQSFDSLAFPCCRHGIYLCPAHAFVIPQLWPPALVFCRKCAEKEATDTWKKADPYQPDDLAKAAEIFSVAYLLALQRQQEARARAQQSRQARQNP